MQYNLSKNRPHLCCDLCCVRLKVLLVVAKCYFFKNEKKVLEVLQLHGVSICTENEIIAVTEVKLKPCF